MRTRIDFGIDLGTTNSAIAKIESGEARIVKSDTQKDTLPSCVFFRKNAILVGDTAYSRVSDEHLEAFKEFSKSGNTDHEFNTFIEFKRTMGTPAKFTSKNAGRSFSSEELSAEVLKTLKSFVRDEAVEAAVITVPAKFRNNQIDATQKAAELAGFRYCELIAEPTAASIAYGVSGKNINGHWLVFDFGGGTFDAALMRVEDGVMKVLDTGGDNHLGGKDIDYAIVDDILVPYVRQNYEVQTLLGHEYGKSELREALKFLAEEAKIAISPPSKSEVSIFTDKPLGEDDDGEEIELDIRLTLADFEKAVCPVYQRAIDITKKLLKNNKLAAGDLEMVLLVGGPTLSQTLRRMLAEQLETRIDTSIDPMTCVAVGAALFASSKDVPIELRSRDRQKVQLVLKHPGTTVETEADVGIRIDRAQTHSAIPDKLFVEIAGNGGWWSSGRIEIVDDAEVIAVQLQEGMSNGFGIHLFDSLANEIPCEPSSFSIIQGFKTATATLPHHLVLDAFESGRDLKILHELSGLRMNQPLPAKGKGVFKTQKDIRPGESGDIIRIPIYETDMIGSRAIYNHPAGIVIISGEDLPKFLPKGSETEISLEVDESRTITFNAYFPDIDETVTKKIERADLPEFDADELEVEIESSKAILLRLDDDSAIIDREEVRTLRSELDELKDLLDSNRGGSDNKTKVRERLWDAAKALDKIQDSILLPNAEEQLEAALNDLRITDERFGDSATALELGRFEKFTKEALASADLKTIQDLTEQINSYDFSLHEKGVGVALEIGWIKGFDDNFDTYEWINKVKAKQLLSDAKKIIADDPTRETLRPIVRDIVRLLPEKERPALSEHDPEYLTR